MSEPTTTSAPAPAAPSARCPVGRCTEGVTYALYEGKNNLGQTNCPKHGVREGVPRGA